MACVFFGLRLNTGLLRWTDILVTLTFSYRGDGAIVIFSNKCSFRVLIVTYFDAIEQFI